MSGVARADTWPATYLQRGLWHRARCAVPAETYRVRAVRFTGRVALDRLAAAVAEVHRALPALGVVLVDRDGRPDMLPHHGLSLTTHDLRTVPADRRDRECVALLRADRDRGGRPCARFHAVRLAEDEVVLGLVGHGLLLDERSLYLVLGAVLQAYQRRFRPDGYRDFTTMLDYHPLGPALAQRRRQWWTEWYAAGPWPVPDPRAPLARASESRRLELTGAQWRVLASSGGTLRDNGSLGVAAVLAWWLRTALGRPAPVLATVIDLRDYFELGPVVGPLTDRAVFRVDLTDAAGPSYRDVFRRAQVGVLRATTHYLPYGDIVGLGVELGRIAPPRFAALWDVDVHLCGNPPGAGRDRGAEDGIDAALFREAELLATGAASEPADWDGTNVDLRVGEVDGGVALVVEVNRQHPGLDADRLVGALAQIIDAAVADPEAPLQAPDRIE